MVSGRRPAWVSPIVRRIHELVAASKVRFTLKALGELAGLALDVDDAIEILASLRGADLHERLRSDLTGEWMFVFKPSLGGLVAYLKVILRDDCIVVSFHEDETSHGDSP